MSSTRSPGLPQSDTVYRDAALGARAAIGHLTREHRRQLGRIAPIASDVYAKRAGRIAAGCALLAGAVAIIGVLVARAVAGSAIHSGAATALLIASWPIALFVLLVTRAVARRRFAVVSHRALAMPDDAYPDLVRMRALDVEVIVARMVDGLEGPSVGLPLAGLALLAPLTLHMLLFLPSGVSVAAFDEWIVLSAVLVGHCHLALAAMAWRYGRVLARRANPDAADQAGWQAWRLTVATSFFPGVFLIAIPVFIVGFTGLFVPVMFAAMRSIIDHERRLTQQISP